MQNSRHNRIRKFFLWPVLLLGLVLLTGCDNVTLTNLTPATLPENPSGIYTITLRVTTRKNIVNPVGINPFIIIEGKHHQMKPSRLGADLYEFDYQITPGVTELAYYFLVNYQVELRGSMDNREAYSEITRASVVNRYVLSLETNRGPVGARISILGRGFTPQDIVYFDNVPVRTVFESANSLGFFVPALDTSLNYKVLLGSTAGTSPVGTFRIDPSNLQVSPAALNLRPGEMQNLTFTVPNPAPAGGLLLDITTDVPESVIMTEVVVPAGQTTVTIGVQGGKSGNGSLFLKGYGAGEITIPVSVR